MKEGGLLETATKEASALASKVFLCFFTFLVLLEIFESKTKLRNKNYGKLFCRSASSASVD